MFASFKTVISDLVAEVGRRNRLGDDDHHIAIAALLIRAASVDSDMSEARRNKLYIVLKSYFGSDDTATAELIEKGTKAALDAVDLYHFTRQINLVASNEMHRRIIQMMWEVIYANGSASPLENNIVWRTADLLGVPSRQRVELQHRIAEASPACREPQMST